MIKSETVEEYYAKRPYLKTNDLSREVSHFNAFRIESLSPDGYETITYGKKNYFKICVVSGKSKIHYADKSFEIAKNGLLFANPLIPYNWEALDTEQEGFSCIFTEMFFDDFGNIKKYPFFQPGGYPVYELNEEETTLLKGIFSQIMEEKDSDFEYRNDVLRNLIFQMIHTALKIRPSTKIITGKTNAAKRITALFLELLESQFPIRNTAAGIPLRSASEFAGQMAVHVNHLNKSVKEATQKTTSEIIAERILREAKIMLKHSTWAVSEIAYSLGFEEAAHFSAFFKKHLHLSPTQFREIE